MHHGSLCTPVRTDTQRPALHKGSKLTSRPSSAGTTVPSRPASACTSVPSRPASAARPSSHCILGGSSVNAWSRQVSAGTSLPSRPASAARPSSAGCGDVSQARAWSRPASAGTSRPSRPASAARPSIAGCEDASEARAWSRPASAGTSRPSRPASAARPSIAGCEDATEARARSRPASAGTSRPSRPASAPRPSSARSVMPETWQCQGEEVQPQWNSRCMLTPRTGVPRPASAPSAFQHSDSEIKHAGLASLPPRPSRAGRRAVAQRESSEVPSPWPHGISLDMSIEQGLAALPSDQASHLVQEALRHTDGDTERASCVLSAALRGLGGNAEDVVSKNPTDTGGPMGTSRSSSASSIGRGLAGGASRVTIYSDHGSGSEDEDVPQTIVVQYPARRSNRCQSQRQVPPRTSAVASASWMESVKEERPASQGRPCLSPTVSIQHYSSDEEDAEQFAEWAHRVETQLDEDEFAAWGQKLDTMTQTFPVRPRDSSSLANPQLPLAAQESHVVVLGSSDCVCYRLPKKSGHAEAPKAKPDRDCSEQVNARCWKYLESRHPALVEARIQRQEIELLAQQKLRQMGQTKELQARRQKSKERWRGDQRIDAAHAHRLHQALAGELGPASQVLASKLDDDTELDLEQLHQLIRMELRVSQETVSDSDIDMLAGVLPSCYRSRRFAVEGFLSFLRGGVNALPAWRVIFPDEKRASELIAERFKTFFERESQRR
eukprot:TRINITY_DN11175_c0_g3_i1.p1 TRINITY_DN11175_c0_g3~~TRINITY_DN11175_c0_g3_i1.p1  ORF type:complete len:724 (-),score=114.17 TRINITY_DN11175_c0_g3_i1:83-2254(-)